MTDLPVFFTDNASRRRMSPWAWLGVMCAVPAACAWMLGGIVGVACAGVAVGLLICLVPNLPPAAFMRAVRAQPIAVWAVPDLGSAIGDLGRRAGLKAPPAIYCLPEGRVSALSTGRAGRSAIAVSEGALRSLTPTQLGSVLAHEMAHINAGDTGLLRAASAVVQITQLVALVGLVAIFWMAVNGGAVVIYQLLAFLLAPVAVTALRIAFSRDREYAADFAAARLNGNPLVVAETLQRIEELNRRRWPRGVRDLAAALSRWFSTHPPIEERVRRLQGLAEMDVSAYARPSRLS